MGKNIFEKDEIFLCTFLALYGREYFSEKDILEKFRRRSLNSYLMKVQNIAQMLDEESIFRESEIKGLTGLPKGKIGRRTNWEWVKDFCKKDKDEYTLRCLELISGNNNILNQ